MFNFKDLKEVNPILPAKKGEEGYPAKKGLKFLGVERTKAEGKPEDKSMVFHFVQPGTNAILDHKEFLPKRRSETQPDAEYKKDVQLNISRIAHIARAYLSQEEFESIGVADPNNMSKVIDNWLEITKQVGILLKKKLESGIDTTCDLKITYRASTKNGKTNYYSSLPQVPPFISTPNHPKEFKVDPTYDLMEIPATKPDSEVPAPQTGNSGNTGGAPAAQSAFSGTTVDSGEEGF